MKTRRLGPLRPIGFTRWTQGDRDDHSKTSGRGFTRVSNSGSARLTVDECGYDLVIPSIGCPLVGMK
ncbi:hypothetical protein A5764_16595 [Mycobacterium sp. 852002-51057_SCH5723018]|nr:hypothetical protein A5764_16595 [Mycobacterium sp. 852002-51057_SCH5723018]